MDIEKMTHQSYRVSVVIAIVLSSMVVVLTALLGRGTLNLNGALLLDEPSDVTVIAVFEPILTDDVKISDIDFLRKEKAVESAKPVYSYQVKTSDNAYWLVKLKFDESSKQWALLKKESLHADAAMDSAS